MLRLLYPIDDTLTPLLIRLGAAPANKVGMAKTMVTYFTTRLPYLTQLLSAHKIRITLTDILPGNKYGKWPDLFSCPDKLVE